MSLSIYCLFIAWVRNGCTHIIIGYKKSHLPLHGSFSILILIASHLSLSHSLLGTHHVLGQFIHQIFYQGILFTDKVDDSSGSPTYYY